MRISVWSKKGGSGKSAISFFLHKEYGYKLAANDYGVFERSLGKDGFDYIPYEQEFKKYPDDEDVVFDLGGMLSAHAKSIVSAVKMSDVVLVPVWFEETAINGAVISIQQIAKFNTNIVVVATQLERESSKDKDKIMERDFSNSHQYLLIKNTIQRWSEKNMDVKLPVFSTQNTKMYKQMQKYRKSATELMVNPLLEHNWRNHKYQIERVHDYIVENYGKK